MDPVSPVLRKHPELEEKVFAKYQLQFRPLPVIECSDPQVTRISRWHLTWRERLRVLRYGDIYHSVWSFGCAPMPVTLTVEEPEVLSGPWPGKYPETRWQKWNRFWRDHKDWI